MIEPTNPLPASLWRSWVPAGIGAGLALFLVGLTFHLLTPLILPGLAALYEKSCIFRPWEGQTRVYMALHPFGFGVLFAGGFVWLRRVTQFPRGVHGGLRFGAGLFALGSLPIFLLMFASIKIPWPIAAWWVLQNLLQYLAAGMVVGAIVDGMNVRISTRLPASAQRVWEMLLRRDTFLFITRGMMGYRNPDELPDPLLTAGNTIRMHVRLLHVGPAMPHKVNIVRVDPTQRIINTEESGGAVRVWNHQMQIEPLSETESRYTDSIHLEAGLLTPLVWLFASSFYRHRQRRWRKLLLQT